MADAGGIAMKVVAVSVVVMIVASIIAVTMAPPPVTNPDINSYAGLVSGDTFNYTLSGTFNVTSVVGTLNMSFASKSWGYQPIGTSNLELNDLLTHWSLPPTSVQLGVGKYATPFGIKQVVRTFDIVKLPGGMVLTTIGYIGVNPNVAYGFALNSPWFHLVLALDQTVNERVKTGNTNSITWHNPITSPSPPLEGGGAVPVGVGILPTYYAPNGGHLFFNLTGDRIDVWAFSEANMRSMADGGPFAYNIELTRWGATDQSGDAVIPTGVFSMGIWTHGAAEGHYTYSIV